MELDLFILFINFTTKKSKISTYLNVSKGAVFLHVLMRLAVSGGRATTLQVKFKLFLFPSELKTEVS